MGIVDIHEDSRPGLVTDGRRHLELTAEFSACVIEEGSANLFVELLTESGESAGYRRRIATLRAGAALPLPDAAFSGMRLLLVGIGEARIGMVKRGQSAAAAVRPERLDSGIATILEGIQGEQRGSSDWTIEPGETQHYELSGRLSSRHVAWIEIAETTETKTAETTQRVMAPILVGPGRSVEIPAGSTVRAQTTRSAIAAHGWLLLDRWASETFLAISAALSAEVSARQRRAVRRMAGDRDQVTAALHRVAAIVQAGANRHRPAAEDGTSSLVTVVGQVCAAEGIPFDPAAEAPSHHDAVYRLQELLRRSNLRFRKIQLEGGWWMREGASFIGFDAQSNDPVAILRRGSGRFERIGADRSERIDAGIAAGLRAEAFVIFRPLPFRPIGLLDLVRHVLATPARFDLRWAACMALATALLALLPPFLTGKLLNEIIPFSETGTLLHLALGLAFVAIGSALFQVVRSVALLRIEAFADGALQAAIWDRLLRLPLAFFRRYEVGDLLLKVTAPMQLRQALSDTVMSSALSAIFSLANFGLMLTYDATLAVAAIIFTLVTGAILFGLAWLQLRYERFRLRAMAADSSFLIQMLVGIQKLRLMGAEDRAYARWLQKFADQRLQAAKAGRVGNVMGTLEAVLPILASLLFFYLVGTRKEPLPVGDFAAFSAAFGMFHGALLGLIGAVSQSLAAIPIYENMKPLLAEQPEIDPERRIPGALQGHVALGNVSFRYEAAGPLVLDGIDIAAAPGEFVALVGPSGSGKSTIFRLLLGFEAPETGTVSYDGQDLAHLDLKAVRRQIGVVLQRGAILPGSLFENIVGSAPLSHEEAWEAARMAGFAEDIRRMPMGMHTMLAEGGGMLSGGQRQRLMIARAIVRRPRILLMDEATSALDNRTQAIVAESLAHLNATRLVIAHRLSTVVHADRIYVIERGRIAQSGTYDELMQADGPFRELARRQIV